MATQEQEDLWAEVITAMRRRQEVGLERYGQPVQCFNGKDAIQEAQEELLDGVVYLHQAKKEARLLGEDLKELWKEMLDESLDHFQYCIAMGNILIKYHNLLGLKEDNSVPDPTKKEDDSAG